MRIGLQLQIASTFTCTPIAPSLERGLADAGFESELKFIQFTQMSEYVLASMPDLGSIAGTVVLLRLEDWLRETLLQESARQPEDTWVRNELRTRAEEFISQFAILSRLATQSWLLVCPSDGWMSRQYKLPSICRTFSNLVLARVRSLPRAVVLSAPGFLSSEGTTDLEADRFQNIPFSESGFRQLGEWAGQQIANTLAKHDPDTASKGAGSRELANYLANLQLNVRLVPAGAADRSSVDRILRTVASFSLTGEKPTVTEAEVDAALQEEGCFLVSVSDRIGDYGPAGLLVYRNSGESLLVECLALSCTILGKQVEYALLSALGRMAAEHGCAVIEFAYVQSPRNQPMQSFLQQVANRREDGRYILSSDGVEDRIAEVAANPGAWTITG